MITSKPSLFFLCTLLWWIFHPSLVLAQADNVVGIPVQLGFSSSPHSSTTQPSFTVSGSALELYPGASNGSANFSFATTNSASYPNIYSGSKIVRLELGRAYFIRVQGQLLTQGKFTVNAPPGYTVSIDGYPRSSVNLGRFSQFGGFTVRVTSNQEDVGGPAGQSSSLASNKVHWLVSLGSCLNGSSAGSLIMSDVGTMASWTDLFNPYGIDGYAPPSTEITVYRGSAPNATKPYLRQIISNQVIVDVVTPAIDSEIPANNYELRFYSPFQRTGTTLPFTFSVTEKPFVKYRIGSPVPASPATTLKITGSWLKADGTTYRTASTTVQRSGSSPNFTWTVQDWSDSGTSLVERKTTSTGAIDGTTYEDSRIETYAIGSPGSSTPTITGTRAFELKTWGEEPVTQTSGSASPMTTDSVYYDVSNSTLANRGFLKSTVSPGGNWEAYDYLADPSSSSLPAPMGTGMISHRYRPFNSWPLTVPTTLSTTSGVVSSYTYATDAFGALRLPASIRESINGTPVASTDFGYASAVSSLSANLFVVTITRTDHNFSTVTQADETLVSKTKYFREDAGVFPEGSVTAKPEEVYYRNLPYSTQAPDGAKVSYAYLFGTFNDSPASGNSAFTASAGAAAYTYPTPPARPPSTCIAAISGTDGSSYTTYQGFTLDPLDLVEGKSILSLTIRDYSGLVRRTETWVWSAAGAGSWKLVSWVGFDYDVAGHLTKRTLSNGATYSAIYSGNQLQSETDESGATTTYSAYDDAGRIKTVNKPSGQVINYTYDPAGHITKTELSSADTAVTEKIASLADYDDAGRLKSQTPAGLGATTFSYSYSSNGWSQTATAPDSGTITQNYQLDGQLASVIRSSPVDPLHPTDAITLGEYYSYDVETDGRRYVQVNQGSATSARFQKRWVDWLGRNERSSTPGFSLSLPSPQPAFVIQNKYEAATGHLLSIARSDCAPILYGYNTLGQPMRTGLDVNLDGSITPSATNKTDRITDQDTIFELDSNSVWWAKNTVKTYPFDGPANGATAVVTSVTRTRLTGFGTGGILGELETTDAEGNKYVTTTTVPSAGTVVTSTTAPGLSGTQSTTSTNGQTTSATGFDGLTTDYKYDGLGRLWKTIDPRKGTSITTYYTGSGLLKKVTDAALNDIVTNTYDTSGRTKVIEDAAGHNTRFEYDYFDRVIHKWGDGTYPVSYGYDPLYGDLTSMSTYRSASAEDSPSWPSASIGTADTTQWIYDIPSGLLYQRKDAAGKTVEFDYNLRGQPSTRKWARMLTTAGKTTTRVTTTYDFDSKTGELLTQSYNDTAEPVPTPTVSYTYTRSGQLYQVTDGTGQRTFNYVAAKPWRLENEALPGFFGSRILTRSYETASSVSAAADFPAASPVSKTGHILGGYTGFNVGTELQSTYKFDPLGRQVGVIGQIGAGSGQNFVYSYKANSNLLGGYTIGTNFAVARDYESNRDVQTKVQSNWGSGTTLSQFDYTNNSIGQQTSALQSGSAFSEYYTGLSSYSHVFNNYSYNARGELQTAALYRGNTPPAAGVAPTASDELPGHRFEYRYDAIGNRTTSGDTASVGADSYTMNDSSLKMNPRANHSEARA